MALSLRGRSLLRLDDFTPAEIHYLLDLASELKVAKREGREEPRLRGRNIALIFEKTSTRTRSGFEVAAYDQGAHVTYIGPTGSQIGHKESMKDTARVLGRMYDGIEYRGFAQESVEELARYSGVPVWNGLTDQHHPTQVIADVLTMEEHATQPLERVSFAFLGHTENNMSNSLLMGAAKLGMDIRLAAPKLYWPRPDMIEPARAVAAERGARILVTESVEDAVRGVDFIYTDVWVSLGEPDELWEERIRLLRPYQVNRRVMELSGNPAVKFMHCLPAFHDRNTIVGEQIFQKYGLDGMEVTNEVFESEASIVFDQAENRMHTIKAILVATLAG